MIILRNQKMFSLAELSEKFQLPQTTFKKHLQRGLLKGHEIAGQLYVSEASVQNIFQVDHEKATKVFVARQPIFDVKKDVFAYELLFRSGLENFFDFKTPLDKAASKTISNTFLVIGVDTLTNGKKAFINFTQNLLENGVPFLLPRGLVVVELLENIRPDEEVVEACRRLKAAGFVLALDDFVFSEGLRPLVDLADIIKVDFLETTGDERKRIMEKAGGGGTEFLAEKVETVDDFLSAVDMGYNYFQGYFFSKPVIIQGSDLPGNKLTLMKLIHEVNKPETGFEKIENIVKHDLSLSYKLLRFINSAFYGFSVKIESIKHALVLLGVREVKKWVSLIALSGLAYDKPRELMNVSVLRAKFCEALARSAGLGRQADDCFLMGMFSLIDALIDRPLPEILSELPLANGVKEALLSEDNHFQNVLQLVLAYERGAWPEVPAYARRLNVNEEALPGIYMDAVEWTNKAF